MDSELVLCCFDFLAFSLFDSRYPSLIAGDLPG